MTALGWIEQIQVLENLMGEGAEFGGPRWRLFDVVELIDLEFLRAVLVQANRRW
jgi:hypothetical protein